LLAALRVTLHFSVEFYSIWCYWMNNILEDDGIMQKWSWSIVVCPFPASLELCCYDWSHPTSICRPQQGSLSEAISKMRYI
jgi:hypothetical protein